MSRRLKRWLSVLMLAMLAFSQASLAIAACAMDRGQLAQMLSQQADHECCDEAAAPAGPQAMPMSAISCLTHSTSDLQALGIPVSIAPAPAHGLALFLRPEGSSRVLAARTAAPPRKAVPPRILLHSFLI